MSSLAAGQTARAIYDYEARAADELSFKRADVINVLGADEEDEGWYRGELQVYAPSPPLSPPPLALTSASSHPSMYSPPRSSLPPYPYVSVPYHPMEGV